MSADAPAGRRAIFSSPASTRPQAPGAGPGRASTLAASSTGDLGVPGPDLPRRNRPGLDLPRRALLRGAAGWGLSALAAPALAQGYGGLSDRAQGYAPVTPGRRFAFPRDHGAHPEFRIEWWYVTANLTAQDGRPFGLQWTLFRQAISPDPAGAGWSTPQVWLAHAALTSASAHVSAEKLGRAGVGQAGVAAQPFRAWIDDWRLQSREADFSPLRLFARGEGFLYDLDLTARGPLVLQGQGGYSRKSEGGQASYYYSHPFLEAEGEIALEGESQGRRIPVTGRAWLDREWSSQPLAEDQPGWDWFALHLPAGEKLMLYRMRRRGGPAYLSAVHISAAGDSRALQGVAMRPVGLAPVAGREVPTNWAIEIPSLALSLTTAPLNPQSWMGGGFPYWEGPIRFEGTHPGVGYMELTGY